MYMIVHLWLCSHVTVTIAHLGYFISSGNHFLDYLYISIRNALPKPRDALPVGVTRQPCCQQLKEGTHAARHHHAPPPRHMRSVRRQPSHARCTPARWHHHTRALCAPATHRHRSSCTRSIEYSKAAVLQVQSAAGARKYQLVQWVVRAARAGARHTCALRKTSNRGARRLSCDARTPGRHARALGHDVRVRGCTCCTPLGRSADADAVVTLAFPGALEP